MNSSPSQRQPIELYYIAQMAKELERLIDHLKELEDNEFLKDAKTKIESFADLLEKIEKKNIQYSEAVKFVQSVTEEVRYDRAQLSGYHKIRIHSSLRVLSETLLDWVVTLEILK